jgi:hypothetical protein
MHKHGTIEVMKRKVVVLIFLSIIILAGLFLIPLKTSTIGLCQNIPLPVHLSLIKGQSIEKETQKLGGNKACPSVELKLYVL